MATGIVNNILPRGWNCSIGYTKKTKMLYTLLNKVLYHGVIIWRSLVVLLTILYFEKYFKETIWNLSRVLRGGLFLLRQF
jgi:hypothetical protein